MGRADTGGTQRGVVAGFGISPRIFFGNPGETLTGAVQGIKASDIEERSARAMNKLPEWSYRFQVAINPITGTLSIEKTHLVNEVEIDFFAWRGNDYRAILVDGEISHFLSRSQKALDEEKTERINEYMKKIGQGDAIRVPFWKLDNQEHADRFYRQLLI